jgi:hypothetical protein
MLPTLADNFNRLRLSDVHVWRIVKAISLIQSTIQCNLWNQCLELELFFWGRSDFKGCSHLLGFEII